jgi:hypothetical protein
MVFACHLALRKLVLALYVLGLVLPLSVQAGIHLQPTPLFKLLQDIAASRCELGQGNGDSDHSAEQCCVLCDGGFKHASTAHFQPTITLGEVVTSIPLCDQTTGLRLGVTYRPLNLRGPPLSSPH